MADLMSTSSVPPSSGGCGTFLVAAWNIHCGRNAGLASAAKGLAQMGVAVAVLTEMKITDDCYPHFMSRFKVLLSKAAKQHQGGIALLWRENHPGVEVKATQILTPNLLTFQLVTGNERYYCMGVYIPPPWYHGGGGLMISLGRMPQYFFGGLEHRFLGPL